MVYEYKGDVKYSVPAQTVGKIFEKIEKREGKVTNVAVLDSARPASSPIHKIFEWDDQRAAEQYRLGQATRLICSVYAVTEEVETAEPIKVRAFVNVSVKKEGEFVSVARAFTDEDMRAKVLADAMKELNAFRQKYENYTEFARLFNEIEKLKIA